jgi:hypothetical protein
MSAEMRGMREGLDRVMHSLTPRGVSVNPAFDAVAISREANHRIPASNDILPDPMSANSIARPSTSELVLGRGQFNPEFALDMSQTRLPAKGLNTAASEAASGDDEVLKRRRLGLDHGRMKSCTQCRLHKVMSRSLSPQGIKLTRLLDQM